MPRIRTLRSTSRASSAFKERVKHEMISLLTSIEEQLGADHASSTSASLRTTSGTPRWPFNAAMRWIS